MPLGRAAVWPGSRTAGDRPPAHKRLPAANPCGPGCHRDRHRVAARRLACCLRVAKAWPTLTSLAIPWVRARGAYNATGSSDLPTGSRASLARAWWDAWHAYVVEVSHEGAHDRQIVGANE